MEELIDLLRPLVGERADEIVRSLVSMIRESEGGVKGFFARIRSAGFGSNLDRWLEGASSEVSPALVANLFGAGSIDQLAERNELPVEKVTQAASMALPHLTTFLAVEAVDDQRPDPVTAQNTKEKPAFVWAFVAPLLTVAAIWASFNMGQPQGKNKYESPQLIEKVTHKESAGVPLEVAKTEFRIWHEGVGVKYTGKVPKDHVGHMQAVLEEVLGDKASGALIGADVESPNWMAHFDEIVGLMTNPKRVLELNLDGNHLTVDGAASDLEVFRKELDAMVTRLAIDKDSSHVGRL